MISYIFYAQKKVLAPLFDTTQNIGVQGYKMDRIFVIKIET